MGAKVNNPFKVMIKFQYLGKPFEMYASSHFKGVQPDSSYLHKGRFIFLNVGYCKRRLNTHCFFKKNIYAQVGNKICYVSKEM